MTALVLDKAFLSSGESLSEDIALYPDGIILPIDKPYRWTSADVIRKLKFAACRHFSKKNLKVGHAGTLDPLATGVLLVCIGKATKLAEVLQRHSKEYLAGVTFGATTPSYDLEKDIDCMYPHDRLSRESLEAVLPGFIGEQEQIAPLFSAKSVDGVRAYELARKQYKAAMKTRPGTVTSSDVSEETVEILPEPSVEASHDETLSHSINATASSLLSRQMINISALELLDYGDNAIDIQRLAQYYPKGAELPVIDPLSKNTRINVTDNSSLSLPCVLLKIACSKGTYIRALARDLGEALGTGAHLSSLCRSRSGAFSLSDAITLSQAIAILGKA